MDPATIFTLCNTGVLPFWLLLAVAPGWVWTARLVHSALVPALYAAVNLGAFLTSAGAPR